jgi:hypothetical protein
MTKNIELTADDIAIKQHLLTRFARRIWSGSEYARSDYARSPLMAMHAIREADRRDSDIMLIRLANYAALAAELSACKSLLRRIVENPKDPASWTAELVRLAPTILERANGHTFDGEPL